MSTPLPISLRFGDDVPTKVRSRISYVFKVFAAIYDHEIVDAESSNASLHCYYDKSQPEGADSHMFHIPALYRDIVSEKELPRFEKHRYAEEEFYLAFGINAATGWPDWLGEIFLWLTSSYETCIAARDAVGRIPYREMVFSRDGVSPKKPHAALLMAWLENVLHEGNKKEALPKAPSPVPGIEHLVVCSHDIDFYFVDRLSTLVRLIKNLAIAFRPYQSWTYFSDNLRMMLQLFCGKRVGDYLPPLLEAACQGNFRSTFFVVPRQGHRRDPNYQLDQILPRLSNAAKRGFSVEVHGSYRSVMEDRSLTTEAQTLGEYTLRKPLGNRQHWLRFSLHQDLFAEIERAGLVSDSTLGFPEMVGFRNGASFAFPPYNFTKEKPHDFLEIPLVLMDGNLESASRSLRVAPQDLAEEVLGESRKRGWGGIAVLWHNPMEPLSVPVEINSVFWSCAKKQKEYRENWMSLEQFLACSIGRYRSAGLLEGVRIDVTATAGRRELPERLDEVSLSAGNSSVRFDS